MFHVKQALIASLGAAFGHGRADIFETGVNRWRDSGWPPTRARRRTQRDEVLLAATPAAAEFDEFISDSPVSRNSPKRFT